MTIERFLVGSVEPLGEREVGVIAATDELARDGHVLEPAGLNLAHYRQNPIVLWQHQPEEPVGVATAVGVVSGSLAARIQFAPAGASATADEICALTKAGIVRGVSIGFEPVDVVPLDPKMGSRGGMHILTSELLEISFCAVPMDTGAGVVARSFKSRVGADRILSALPLVTSTAIQRALARFGPNTDRKPSALLSPRQQFETDRQRTMTAWALGQATETERRAIADRYSYEQRQADLRALSGQFTH